MAAETRATEATTTATLVFVHTTPNNDTFRVLDEAGRLIFATRSYPTPKDHAAAKRRLARYCNQTNTRLVDTKGRVVIEPEPPTVSAPPKKPSRRTWGRS